MQPTPDQEALLGVPECPAAAPPDVNDHELSLHAPLGLNAHAATDLVCRGTQCRLNFLLSSSLTATVGGWGTDV